MKYQVLTADKTDDVTLEAAQAALTEEYPEYKVEVHDDGHQFIAKLTSKTAADDEEEDDGGDDAPSGKKPPFLEEKGDDKDDDAGDDDEGDEPKKKPADDDGDDDDDGGDKDDLGGPGDDDPGSSDVVKALKALKELDHILPKLRDQLKGLNGGDDLGGPDGGDVHGLVPPPPPGGPGGPPGGPPAGPPHGGVGPTPGAPPAAALPGGPPGPPGKGIPAPNVGHGLDMRKGPQVGPSTFGSVKDKFLNRPVTNPDGSRLSLIEASQQIAENPRYASYYVNEVKYDEENDQWVAHLKSRS